MKRILLISSLLFAGINAEAKDALAVSRINNLDAALQEVNGLMQMIQMPLPVSQATMPLGQLLMSPSLKGIDTTRPITVYVGESDSPSAAQPSLAVRFFVPDDGSTYIESVSSMLPSHEKQSETIHKFPMSPPGVDNGMAFYTVIKNRQVLAGYDLSEMQSLVKSVSRDDSSLLKAFPGNLSVLVNTVAMEKKIATQLEKYNEMMEQMKAMGVDNSTKTGAMDPAAMMESYNNMVSLVLSQIDSLVLNVDFNNQLTLRIFAKPKADTTLASIVEKITPPGTEISAMDVSDSLFGGFGTLEGMDELLEPYAKWVADIYSSMGSPMDSFADSYETMVMAMKGIYSGGYNFFLLKPNESATLQMIGVYETDDKVKAQESMDAMMKLQAEQMALLSETDASAAVSEPTESEYRGLQVTSYAMDMKLNDEISKDLPPGYMDMMSKMNTHTAITDDYIYYALGDISNLDAAIDHFSAGGTGAPITKGFEDITTEIFSYWYMDLPAVLGSFAGAIGFPGSENINMDGISGVIRGVGVKEQGGVSSLIRLTADDIKGLVQMGMRFSMMAQQAAPQNPAAPSIDPATGLPVGFDKPGDMDLPEGFEPVEE